MDSYFLKGKEGRAFEKNDLLRIVSHLASSVRL